MDNKLKVKRLTGRWMVILLCLLIVAYVSLRASGDNDLDVTAALSTHSVQQLKATMDSVYADISAGYPAIQPILKNSCYDCHSTQTEYPWYYKIPTINSMIDSDIKEGREHLELSNGFPFGGSTDQLKLLKELRAEVEENEMPLLSYRIMHWGTTIEGATQDSLFLWVDSSIAKLEQMYESLGIPVPSEKDSEDSESDD